MKYIITAAIFILTGISASASNIHPIPNGFKERTFAFLKACGKIPLEMEAVIGAILITVCAAVIYYLLKGDGHEK